MLAHLAAEISVPRPNGAGGWILILVLLATTIWVVTAGFRSLFQSMSDRIRPVFYGVLGLGAAYLFVQNWYGLQSDPLVNTEIEVFPNTPSAVEVDGTVQLNGDSVDHSHDSVN